MPFPTTITCAGSWPEPEPWMIDTLSSYGASARMIRLYSGTYFSVSGFATAMPCSISATNCFGSFTNFFIRAPPDRCGGSVSCPVVGDSFEEDGDSHRSRVERADAALARVGGPSALGEHRPRRLRRRPRGDRRGPQRIPRRRSLLRLF